MGRRSCPRRLEADGTGQDVVYAGVGVLAGEGLGSGAFTGDRDGDVGVFGGGPVHHELLVAAFDRERSVLDRLAGAGLVVGADALDREAAFVVDGDDEQGVGVLGDVLACTASRQGLAERGDVGGDPVRALTVHGMGGTLVDDDAAVTQHATGGPGDAVRVVHARTSCDDDQHG
jgi:hypothetical protein